MGLLVMAQIFKPRLPRYSFRILKFPWLQRVNGQFKTRLFSKVGLRNDNYVPIDVHALSFDLFYPDWKGSLAHIGHVHDTKQVASPIRKKRLGNDSTSATSDLNSQLSILTETIVNQNAPLWALSPRQTFETTDEVFMQPAGFNFRVVSSLGWDLFQQGGTLLIPSSGVIQVKAANAKIPLTLSILCDNRLDAWTLEMQGLECELDALELGWKNMAESVKTLRSTVLQNHAVWSAAEAEQVVNVESSARSDRARGTVLGRKPAPPSFQEEFEKLSHRLEWKQVMPMLAV